MNRRQVQPVHGNRAAGLLDQGTRDCKQGLHERWKPRHRFYRLDIALHRVQDVRFDLSRRHLSLPEPVLSGLPPKRLAEQLPQVSMEGLDEALHGNSPPLDEIAAEVPAGGPAGLRLRQGAARERPVPHQPPTKILSRVRLAVLEHPEFELERKGCPGPGQFEHAAALQQENVADELGELVG